MAVITGFNDVDDRLEGFGDKDVISGLSGDDTLIGGAERDTLLGGDGDDIIATADFSEPGAKSQDDVVDGAAGIDRVNLDYADLVFVGSEKPIALTFTFSSAAFQIQIDGFVGASISNCEQIDIRMADGSDYASGGARADYISAADGNDTVLGQRGDDTIVDALGKASLDGGDGRDTIQFLWSENDDARVFDIQDGAIRSAGKSMGRAENFEVLRVSTGAGADKLKGGDFADSINAGAGKNEIEGRGGADEIYCYDGNDRIDAGSGNDRVSASLGDDTVIGGTGADYVDAGEGKDRVEGGAGNDTLVGASGFIVEDDTLDGGAGDDVLSFGKGAIVVGKPTAIGGSGTDTLELLGLRLAGKYDLADGSAELKGGGGIQSIEIFNIGGSKGDDTIITATGDDTLDGAGGNDLLRGGGGDDLIYGNVGADTLEGGAGNDHLYATYYFLTTETTRNVFDGGEGNDTIDALAGDDAAGGAGTDLLSYGTTSTSVDIDLEKALTGKGGGPKITGFENFYGTNQDDRFFALKKGGEIDAGYGNDTIVGREGDDTIEGSVGADEITLGKGEDTLLFFSLGDRVTSDVIKDFNVKDDQIQLDAFSRIIPAGVMTDDYLTRGDFGGTAPTTTVAHAMWFYDKSSGELFLDWDGGGSSYQTVLMATFENRPDLEAKDFFVSLIG